MIYANYTEVIRDDSHQKWVLIWWYKQKIEGTHVKSGACFKIEVYSFEVEGT